MNYLAYTIILIYNLFPIILDILLFYSSDTNYLLVIFIKFNFYQIANYYFFYILCHISKKLRHLQMVLLHLQILI